MTIFPADTPPGGLNFSLWFAILKSGPRALFCNNKDMTAMYFDTHAHYGSELYDTDRDSLIASMPAQGVELILNPGCTLESSLGAVALAEKFPHVYAAVGVHPSDCQTWSEPVQDRLRELAAHPKVKAIGEIGLDYYWKDNAPADLQKHVFTRQLELARETNLPVIVHNRDAHKDTMDILRQHKDVPGQHRAECGHAVKGDVAHHCH